jgi:hypothetical protein
MKLQAIVSAAALAAAMLVAGPVAAQQTFMIGDETIPVDQVDNFKEACEGLRAANLASLTASDDQNEEQTDATQTGSVATDSSQSSGSPDPAAQEKWTALMATLTTEECEAAGFYAGP